MLIDDFIASWGKSIDDLEFFPVQKTKRLHTNGPLECIGLDNPHLPLIAHF